MTDYHRHFGKKIPQDKMDNIYASFITSMVTNKEDIVEVDGFGAIPDNNKSAKKCLVYASFIIFSKTLN